MVVKTSADVTILTMDGISYGPQGDQWTALSSYGSLSEAIADIGATDTVLLIDTTDTLNANVTVPTNVTLMCTKPDAITLNSKTLTVNGGIWSPAIECFIGTGTFTGSPIVQFYDPTWTASTVTDSATPSYKNITLSEPTLLTPVIADFSNATHTHGADSTGGLIATSVRDTSRGLIINDTNVTTVKVVADELILQDASGGSLRVSSFDSSAAITNSGIYGLDVAPELTSTWFYIWVIGNATANGTMISNSSTAPTLPSGYTHKGLFGAVYNDSGDDFDAFEQRGERANIDDVVVTTTYGAIPTFAPVDMTALVPATARKIFGSQLMQLPSGAVTVQNCFVAFDSGGFGEAVTGGAKDSGDIVYVRTSYLIAIENQTSYASETSGVTTCQMRLSGWEY
jgi:hypothetical protein